jgi:hypothetical protein
MSIEMSYEDRSEGRVGTQWLDAGDRSEMSKSNRRQSMKSIPREDVPIVIDDNGVEDVACG